MVTVQLKPRVPLGDVKVPIKTVLSPTAPLKNSRRQPVVGLGLRPNRVNPFDPTTTLEVLTDSPKKLPVPLVGTFIKLPNRMALQ